MYKTWISLIAAIALTFAITSQASASGPLDLGDRNAVTANFSVSTVDPDDLPKTTVLTLSTTISRSTADARWEYGGGFFLTAVLTDLVDVTVFTPNVTIRINTNLLGPEENILAYVGFIAGVSFLDVDADDFSFTDEVGSFGPKFGAEYYFTSNVAIQLEDSVLFDTDGGITNTLMLGAKLLF